MTDSKHLQASVHEAVSTSDVASPSPLSSSLEFDRSGLPRCATCRYWSPSEEYQTGHGMGIGACKATPMFWESTEWREDGEGREWTAEAATTTAFVQDGSDYVATLYTKPQHGCVMHESVPDAAMAAASSGDTKEKSNG